MSGFGFPLALRWQRPIRYDGQGIRGGGSLCQAAKCCLPAKVPDIFSPPSYKIMMDYQIQPNTKVCAATGRELQPGEKFFTALLEENHQLIRKDFSYQAWKGPPEGTFSFWMGHIPADEGERRPQIDDEVLVDCFHRLEGETEPRKVQFRYVTALLLMRRKRFKFDDAKLVNGQEVLVVRCSRSKKNFEVINPKLSEEEIALVQEEVFKVLGWD